MKIVLNGACGRMGAAVIEYASAHGVEVAAAVDAAQTPTVFSAPFFRSLAEVDVDADVLIDFSHHSATPDIVSFVRRTGMPAVVATTGHTESERAMLSELSKKTAVFTSRNMSLGINVVIGLCRDAVKRLGNDCDVEIVEKHHRNKLDAPSGTALMIAEEIADVLPGNTEFVFDRTGRRCVRPDNEIGISSVRAGGIFGEHEIIISREGETITIKHTAESRALFASGAIKAAEFIMHRQNGLYSMKELLKEEANEGVAN